MLNTAFAPWPSFTEEEATAVAQVLRSNRVNYWTGTESRDFEKEFAVFCGTRHAVALANGTLALDLAWRALGIGPGDEVVVTPRTFLASVSSIVNAGARPVFADVCPDSQNITPETVRAVLTPRTRAVLCVHLAGWPCEMDGLNALAAEHGLKVVEDCAQAHGARYRDRPVGGLADMAAWSFCQDKIMTTGGEGGMLTLDDEAQWQAAWSYKDHGKSFDAVYRREHPPGFRWVHDTFGTNWRITEMQSVLGRLQLVRMPAWHAARTANAEQLMAVARACPVLRVPEIPAHITHAWYKFYVFVRPERLASGWTRDRLLSEISFAGVPCYTGSCAEVYLEGAFAGTSLAPPVRLPVARELGETALMLLVHPTLTPAQMTLACDTLRAVATRALG